MRVLLQIVMSANKEAVLSEKIMTAGFGQTIVVGYSEPIHSTQFPDFEGFASKVQQEWDHQWKRVYSSKPGGKASQTYFLATCFVICPKKFFELGSSGSVSTHQNLTVKVLPVAADTTYMQCSLRAAA